MPCILSILKEEEPEENGTKAVVHHKTPRKPAWEDEDDEQVRYTVLTFLSYIEFAVHAEIVKRTENGHVRARGIFILQNYT